MKTVFIVTEANADVATGHLMECIVCAKALREKEHEVSFWVNDDMENGLKKRIPCEFREYHKSIESDYEVLLEEVYRTCPEVLLFNLRKISESFLRVCKTRISDRTAVICIDEFGHRNLPADIIINPMIDSYYWDYGESKARFFCGAKYLILPERLTVLHKREKKINSSIKKIVITMGGVDVKNYTSDLSGIVSQCFPEATIELIIGGGNRNREVIIRNSMRFENIIIRENVSNLLDLLYEADLIFCAGGNTLHEAACIGTPAIILPSMPHEIRTAKCFEERGFGLVVDTETNWRKEIPTFCAKIVALEKRCVMSIKGKCLSDGLGNKRVIEIINHMR